LTCGIVNVVDVVVLLRSADCGLLQAAQAVHQADLTVDVIDCMSMRYAKLFVTAGH